MTNKRIEYYDTLKFIAIFAVIAAHSLIYTGGAEVLNFKLSKMGNICKFAIPVFIMITGALFLNKNIDLKEYLEKRFVRVVYPLIFFTILVFISGISNHILYYYWYSWMIIGVLLAVPIVNKFIQYSNEKEIEYYIVIFIIFSIFCQVCHVLHLKYALDISFFYTPVSYLILGYYIFNKKINMGANKLILLSFIIFLISSYLKLKIGVFAYSHEFQTYLDLSLIQIIQASSLVIFIKSIYDSKKNILYNILQINPIKKYILSISRSCYGMYLIQHPLIFGIIPHFIKPMKLSGTLTCIYWLLIVIGVFNISWIITFVLGKIHFVNKISGYY